MIKLTANHAELRVASTDVLTAGRVGIECTFVFGPEWEGLVKKATFTGAESRTVLLTEGTAVIPWECLTEEGKQVNVGICGETEDGAVVIPTIWGNLGMVRPGAPRDGEPPEEPTPSVVAQIQALAEVARENADSALTKIDGMTAEAVESNEVFAEVTDRGNHKHVIFGIPVPGIADIATKVWVRAQGFLTQHQSLAEYRKSEEQDAIDRTKADLADVPSKVSQLVNDSGFITTQGLSSYRTATAQDILDAGKEQSQNKVVSISSTSTDEQYPSAKCVYEAINAMYGRIIDLITSGEESDF